MPGWEGDGGDVVRIKQAGDEKKPSLANVMVLHQSFERTSRAVEMYAKGWTNTVRSREDRSDWEDDSQEKVAKKERQTTTWLGGRGEREWEEEGEGWVGG
jgi:hypothetical protein